MDLLGLVVCFLGLLAVQTSGQGREAAGTAVYTTVVPKSTTSDRRDGFIDIDDPSQGDTSGHRSDDEDGSGKGDTGDTEEGSAYDEDLSPCQKLRQELLMRDVNVYIPQCRIDGSFERKQCHSYFKECWCVDIKGFEITGTKMKESEFIQNCDFPAVRLTTEPSRGTAEPARRTLPAAFVEPNAKRDKTPEPFIPEENIDANPVVDTDNEYEENIKLIQETTTIAPMGTDSYTKSSIMKNQYEYNRIYVMTQPGILVGIIGGAVVGLFCAVLFVMFIVYRMRKKDDSNYAHEEQKKSSGYRYHQANNKEFYA